MLEASSDRPDNVAALQAMIALQNEKLSIFEAEIKERDYRIEKLEHQLAGLRRHRFGTRSEALDLDLPRFGGELVAHARPAISNWTGLW